jgi:hypothetical protein
MGINWRGLFEVLGSGAFGFCHGSLFCPSCSTQSASGVARLHGMGKIAEAAVPQPPRVHAAQIEKGPLHPWCRDVVG